MAQIEALETRIELLLGELELAIKWDRPAILLAIYTSELVRAAAQEALAAKMRELGHNTINYRVTGPQNADIPTALSQHPEREESIFFVSGLRRGGGKDGLLAYHALNLRREYFVDYRIRAVFWLTESETTKLPHVAPDFWAFRHRTVEFAGVPNSKQIGPFASRWAFAELDNLKLLEDTRAKIALREDLLRELPQVPETLEARSDLLLVLGALYAAIEDFQKAQSYIERSLAISSDLGDERRQVATLSLLGSVQNYAERHHAAETSLHRALELAPDSHLTWTILGQVLSDQGKIKEAEEAYQRASEVGPEDISLLRSFAEFLAQQGRLEEAEATLQRAIDIRPEDPSLWRSFGDVASQQNRLEESKAAYREAVSLDPSDPRAWMSLGDILDRQEQTDEAEAAYRQALDLSPKNDGLLHLLGRKMELHGRLEDAESVYRHSLALEERATTRHDLGAVLEMRGQLQEALEEYQKAAEMQPDRATYHASLAGVLRKLGRHDEVAEHLERARELMKEESGYNKACIEAISGNTDVALTLLEEAIEESPQMRSWARRDPDLNSLRGLPRFKELVDSGS
jgi:tetratricopeptide (TPR) repeat protein